jgi:hypothetical protein
MHEPNARAIFQRCQDELKLNGFVDTKRTTLWRRTNRKFDVLKFDIIPSGRCQKWRVPFGSFGLEPSCLFPFLPRLGHLPTDGLQPEKGFGQIRLSLRREVGQQTVKASNIWWAGDSCGMFDTVLKDVLRVIRQNVLPFFSRFEDAEEVLRTLLEDEDAIGREGVWEFGKQNSPKRFLYLGFAALECAKWDLAISSLRACRDKIAMIPEIAERIRAEMMPFVDDGIVHGEQKASCSIK